MPEIIPIPGTTTAERVKENMKPAQLNEEDMAALSEIIKKFPVQGERYNADGMRFVGN
jgi:pyridoxine 4-dehydrogenase